MSNCGMFQKLNKMLIDRKATIGVVGIGYIGLPTSAFLSTEGFRVSGVDIDGRKVEALNRGESYVKEPGLAELVETAVKSGSLRAYTQFRVLQECDVLIFCVQTPLNSEGDADLSMLYSAIESALKYAKDGVLIICESTVPPGTTRNIAQKFIETGCFELDRNIWVSHCPERVLPGRIVQEFRSNSRVIGGLSKDSATLAKTLYSSLVNADKIIESSSDISEFAKLAENTFRAVNIALANEFAKIADMLGLDVDEVISLANLHPRVTIHKPGVGVGGHCIPKDPILLANSTSKFGFFPNLILEAQRINNEMPIYIIDRLERAQKDRTLDSKKILVLGTAFKENVGDTRLAPSEKILDELRKRGAYIRAHDSYTSERFGAVDAINLNESVNWAEIIFLAVAHSEYMELIPKMDLKDKMFLDGRNAFKHSDIRSRIYLGIGKPLSVEES